MIRIVNLKTYEPIHDDELCIRICRPSPLGNPYIIKNEYNLSERDIACDQYDEYFKNQLINSKDRETAFLKELRRIYKLALTHDIALGCYCVPYKRCHGETIKKFLDEQLAKNLKDYQKDKSLTTNKRE